MGRAGGFRVLLVATLLLCGNPAVLGASAADGIQAELSTLIKESTLKVTAHHAATGKLPNVCADLDWSARAYCPSRFRVERGGNIAITLPLSDAGETGTIRLVPEFAASGELRWHCSAEVPSGFSQVIEASGCRVEEVVPATTPDAITTGEDGTVSVHVDKVPLAWLLHELERARDGIAPQLADVGDACNPPAADETADSEREQMLQTLQEGSDADRYAALLRAEEDAIEIPADVLQTTIESDASERVRLMAFGRYVERAATDPESLREVLTLAAYSYSGAVQAEARRQLQELNEYEALQSAAPEQDGQ